MTPHRRQARRSRFDALAERVDLSPPAPHTVATEARSLTPDRELAAWLSHATAMAATLVALGITIRQHQTWYAALLWTLLASATADATVYFVLSWLFGLLRVTLWLRLSRNAHAEPPETEEPEPRSSPYRREITVNIEEATGNGTKRTDRCRLFSPESRPSGLAFYAAALVREDEKTRAAFSYAGGKHVNGARFYGYTPNEFDDLEKEAKRAGLVEREYKNRPYELTERGQFVFARVAREELAEIQLSPAP